MTAAAWFSRQSFHSHAAAEPCAPTVGATREVTEGVDRWDGVRWVRDTVTRRERWTGTAWAAVPKEGA